MFELSYCDVFKFQYLAGNIDNVCVGVKERNEQSTRRVNVLHVQWVRQVTLYTNHRTDDHAPRLRQVTLYTNHRTLK